MCSSRATGRTRELRLRVLDRLCRRPHGARGVGAGVAQRQVEGERAALPVDAGEPDFAAEQHGQLAADGQAEAGAAVFARRAGVGLLEGLEDEPLLLRRDADAGVLDGEGDDLLGVARARGDRALQPCVAKPTRTSTWPCAVNLTALESRFLRICCRRFESLSMQRGRSSAKLHVERQVLGLGHVPEVAIDGVAQAGEGNLLGLDGDGAGLDLRKIENVVDEVQQVGAGGVDVAGKTRPAWRTGCRAAFSASCWLRMRMELSGVRSSCDMLARNSDLYFEVSASSAAFSSSARRACSTSVFLRSTSAFCSASSLALVPSSSLVCWSSLWRDLQFDGQLLRLLEQALGAHRRLDGVEAPRRCSA